MVILNPYWHISGAWARPISGKLIQSPILEFWGMSETDFWKIGLARDRKIEISKKILDRSSENRSSS